MELIKTLPPAFVGETIAMIVEDRDPLPRGLGLRYSLVVEVWNDFKLRWAQLIPAQSASLDVENRSEILSAKIGVIGWFLHLSKQLSNHAVRRVGDDTTTCARISLLDKMIGNNIDFRSYVNSQAIKYRYVVVTADVAAIAASTTERACPDQQIASKEDATLQANGCLLHLLDARQREVIKAVQRMQKLHATNGDSATQNKQLASVQVSDDQVRLTARPKHLVRAGKADANRPYPKRPRNRQAYLRQKFSALNEAAVPRHPAYVAAQADPSVLLGAVEAVCARFDFAVIDRPLLLRLADRVLLAVHSDIVLLAAAWNRPRRAHLLGRVRRLQAFSSVRRGAVIMWRQRTWQPRGTMLPMRRLAAGGAARRAAIGQRITQWSSMPGIRCAIWLRPALIRAA